MRLIGVKGVAKDGSKIILRLSREDYMTSTGRPYDDYIIYADGKRYDWSIHNSHAVSGHTRVSRSGAIYEVPTHHRTRTYHGSDGYRKGKKLFVGERI